MRVLPVGRFRIGEIDKPPIMPSFRNVATRITERYEKNQAFGQESNSCCIILGLMLFLNQVQDLLFWDCFLFFLRTLRT